ncbi:MAG: FkbM family methyltransferase [Ferruginibacter sp.]
MVGLPVISNLDNGAKFILEVNSTNSTGNIYVKTYEAEYIYFLRKNILREGLMVDIGAHMGLYTLLLNELFTGGYCFEPAKDNFKALRNNLFINDLIEKFIPVNTAVSDTNEHQVLKVEGTFSGINYLVDPNDKNIAGATEVPAVTIDRFLSEKNNNGTITFLKIDTEGHELKVLNGCIKTLQNNPGLIVLFENSSPSGLLELFASVGFKVFSIDSKGKIFSDSINVLNAYNLFAVGREHLLFEQVE